MSALRRLGGLVAATFLAIMWIFVLYPLSVAYVTPPSTALGMDLALGGLTTIGTYFAISREKVKKATPEEKETDEEERLKNLRERIQIPTVVAPSVAVPPPAPRPNIQDVGVVEVVMVQRVKGKARVILQDFEEKERQTVDVQVEG